MSKHVLIIGGGVGGLAAAVRLAGRGYGVSLIEKNSSVGGKLNRWIAPHPSRPTDRPFVFDTGPSLITLPFVFDDLFAAAGEKREDWLTFRRLDPISRFVWADGSRFELRSAWQDLRREIECLSPGDAAGWERFAAHGQRVWDLSAEMFLFHAPEQVINGKLDEPGETASGWAKLSRAASVLSTPLRIGMFRRYGKLVDRCVQSHKLREVLYQYATYSGADPLVAPATLAVIPHAEMHFGGWYIEGGLYRLAEALEAIAKKLGVNIRTSSPVERVMVEQRSAAKPQAAGVRLVGGEVIRGDAVIVNADAVYAYRELIEPAYRPHFSDRKLDALDPGGSGFVLLLGVEGQYPQLAHHTKFMPADYRGDLAAMFQSHTIPDDPCIYVCASTRSDPSQAPPGCENLFVLCSAPAMNKATIDWEAEGTKYRDHIVATLESRFGLTDLSKRIVVERRMSPVDLKRLYNANAGSIYGVGGSSRRTAFLRPPNRAKDIDGLFFAGGATHPGGGLPLVALSGKIVSELIGQ